MCKRVAEDHKLAINSRNQGGSDENDIQNMRFTFNFNQKAISAAMLKLPLEYETNISSFMEQVEANPPTNFDDLVPFDPIEELDFERENYKPFVIPAVSQYDPPLRDQVNRPGCDYESIVRQRAGEPDLEQTQLEAHEQAALLKQDKKDIVSSAIVPMPKTFLKPLDYSVELLIRAD